METTKPEVSEHMIRWGVWSGTVLAVLYQAFFFGWKQDISELFFILTNPVFWAIGLVFAGLPGGIIGWIDGRLLRKLLHDAPLPFSRRAMQSYQTPVYLGLGLLTTLLAFVLLMPAALLSLIPYHKLPDLIGLVAPAPIAGIAAAYAGHRYLFALRLWSESQYGLQKSKSRDSEFLSGSSYAQTDKASSNDEELPDIDDPAQRLDTSL
jgi:hypothetical protein